MIIVGCNNQKTDIKNYGFSKNKSSYVSLKLSEFKNYGIFIDRIREVTCNDSIPKIVIKQKYLTRNVFPTEHCEPMLFDPKAKHYVTFRGGKPYKASSTMEIDSDSLGLKLRDDFAYYRNSNHSEHPESYLVIIESERKDNVDGIENFLSRLTQEFDKLKTDLELNISLWEVVPFIPPPPAIENEKPIE